ncbi:MAG: radical SAM protein [Candidatus Falkowbacteria bacterium]
MIMQTKVLLINSITAGVDFYNTDHLYHFPLGLLYLASVLRKNNIEVKIVDFNNIYCSKALKGQLRDCTPQEYIKKNFSYYLGDFAPDIVGVGCIFSGAFACAKIIASQAKEFFPNTPVVIGGIHATIFSVEILKECDYIDYVCIGEGENTFLSLIKYLTGGNQTIGNINGIAFRKNGEVVKQDKTTFIKDLDTLPPVDFDILNLKDYEFDTSGWYSPKKIKIGTPFPILSSRSCPWRCSFCAMWLVQGPTTRFRTPRHVVDEMQNLYIKHNVRYFSFLDDNLTLDRKRILAICDEIIKRGLDIQFDTPNGVAINFLDQEVIDAMVKAGLVKINLSPESGSEYIRNEVMGKRLKTEKIYEVFQNCAKHNHLYIGAYFIIGMPQETRETLQETYEMITKLPADRVSFSLATPYPGTQLYEYCIEHGLLKYDHAKGYDFKKEYIGTMRPYFKPYALTEDELMEFAAKCENFMKQKRSRIDIPENYPLRYQDAKASANFNL